MRRALATMTSALLCLAGLACSTNDGRQLADPDPALTRVTTTAPTATGEAARGGPASALAVPVSSVGPGGLTVSSPDFTPGAALPAAHTCDGADEAPTVTWAGGEGTASLALVVRDPDAGGRVHWLVTGLRGPSGTIDRTGAPTVRVLPNSFGIPAWSGPCADDDLEHRYVFTLYALPDRWRPPSGAEPPADPDPDTTAKAVVAAIESARQGAATLVAVYSRP